MCFLSSVFASASDLPASEQVNEKRAADVGMSCSARLRKACTSHKMEAVIMVLLSDFVFGLCKLCLWSFGFISCQWNFTPDSQWILVPSSAILALNTSTSVEPSPLHRPHYLVLTFLLTCTTKA